MTLDAGSWLGSYRILGPLGAGGMAEIYRARDTKLGRDVAIKILPAELAADTGRLSRFENEARIVSALNHPNIVSVHEIGRMDGVSFIVMELVEGKTVRGILEAGTPLPLKKIFSIAAQTAEGLSTAHAAGIVHRDLKPENLMVTRGGFVKILDFGLAKLVPVGFEDSRGPGAVTVTRGTEAGTVLGTVGYMSPEQASGQRADFRSDQFSFGSILYEMISGRRAFERPTSAQTLSAIIESEPDLLAALAPKTPANLIWIVERCLAKDPEDRYGSTKDLARDLAVLREHSSGISISGIEPPATRRIRLSARALAAVALAVAALSAVVIVAGSNVRYQPPAFQQLTFRRGKVLRARYTPDGGSIIYGASWEGAPTEIFTARLDGKASRPFGVRNADVLAVSSKGTVAILLKKEHLRIFGGSGTLAVMPLGGGALRELLENVVGADWSPDGAHLAVARRQNDETRIEYPIGRLLYKTKNRLGNEMRVSGSGKQIAFVENTSASNAFAPDEYDLRVVDSTGKVTTLVHASAPRQIVGCVWRPGDREVLFSSWDTAKGHTSDLDVVDLDGKVRTLYRATGDLWAQDSLPDGRLLVLESKGTVSLMFGSSTDPSEKDLGWLSSSWLQDISEDGGAVLFHDETDVYLRRTDGSPAVRLLPQVQFRKVSLSPDGKWVLSPSESEHELELIPTGPGQGRKISIGDLVLVDSGFMPDGKSILFTATGKDGQKRLYLTDETSMAPRAITNTGRPDDWVVSPDGKEIALNDTAGGARIYRLDGSPSRAIEGLDRGDRLLAWSADRRFLFLGRNGDVPARIERLELASGRKELWKTLMPADAAGVYYLGPVLVTRDGRFWAYSVNRTAYCELWQLTGLAAQ
jgi:Tol biopolymer transport system component